MKEKLIGLICLIIAMALFMSGCRASDPVPEPLPELEPEIVVEKEMIQFDEKNSILILVPDGWKTEQRSGTQIRFMARTYDLKITPPAWQKALLQITIGSTENGEPVSGTQVDELADAWTEYALPKSVEESADFIEFPVEAGAGKYCILTDASLVGKELDPDDYLYVAMFLVAYENGCLTYATALFDDLHGDELGYMIDTIASIEPTINDRTPTLEDEALSAVLDFANKAGMFDINRTLKPDYQVDADIISIGRLEDQEGYSIRTSSYNYKCKYSDSLIREALVEGTFQIESDVKIEGVNLNKTDSIIVYIGSDGNWYGIINGEKMQTDAFVQPSIVLSFPVFVSEIDKKHIKSFSKETTGDITSYEVIYDGAGYLDHRELVRYSLNEGILQSGASLNTDEMVYTFSVDSKGTPKSFNFTSVVYAAEGGRSAIDTSEISAVYNSFEDIVIDISRYDGS